MKNARHELILELIDKYSIDKQDELLRRLKENGLNVTQATVSRDIKELHLVKTATTDGGYRYIYSNDRAKQHNSTNRFDTIFKESVLKVDYAGNIVLVKCFTGMANAACEVFDSMVWTDVVGTLSGDDTFFVLLRSEASAQELYKQLVQHIKG